MKKTFWASAALLAALCGSPLQAVNPFLPLWEFIPDGEPYVFEDPDHPGKMRVYVYGSHDNLIKNYCGRDQVVWSAPVEDLSAWRCDGVIFQNKFNARGEALYPDSVGDVLYAPDVTLVTDASGKKTYYLYPNVQHDLRAGLIAKSDRPDGPFEVCNWDPQDPNRTTGILRFDPGVFVDDDGRVYGYWGFERSFGAELDPNTMCTVKPGTEVVEDMLTGRYQEGIYHFFEASSIRKIKDKYVFIYSRFAPEGELGLPETNYTLAYCWSNHPLGPWTYGGTIIDGRGKELQPDGSYKITATPSGNTHGSICEINGQWWVFYHRQAGTDEYSRQAMVAPINVEVTEGEEGSVRISEGEFNSEGFEIGGLNPVEWHAAGIACYFVGPEPAHQEYPNVIYPGSHTQVYRDPQYNRCDMVNNVAGSVVGYKYFDFFKTQSFDNPQLNIKYETLGVAGEMEIWMDRPTEAEGGKCIGKLEIQASTEDRQDAVNVTDLSQYNGKHALFFVFKSETKGQSLCNLKEFCFSNANQSSSNWAWYLLVIPAVAIYMFLRRKKVNK